jgi:hypothetical protein
MKKKPRPMTTKCPPPLLPRRPTFNSYSNSDSSDSNIVLGASRYNSDVDSESDSESDSDSDRDAGTEDNDDDVNDGADQDDGSANNYARASSITHSNADEEQPNPAILLPSQPMSSNQDQSDQSRHCNAIQTTNNINANPESIPASQKSTASHTSRNPSTVTAFNLRHNQPSGNALTPVPSLTLSEYTFKMLTDYEPLPMG